MMQSAGVQETVGIVLKVVDDDGNKAAADKFKKHITAAEAHAVATAKDSAKRRVDILKAEAGEKLGIVSKTNKKYVEGEKKSTTSFDVESRKRVEIGKRESRERSAAIETVVKAEQRGGQESLAIVREGADKKKGIRDKETREVIAAEKAKQEKIKLAHDQQMDGNRRATESSIGALQGAMDLAEGMAILGLASEENFEAFARGFIKVQATFKAVKGFTELIWKAREALMAMQAAQAAATTGNQLLASSATVAGVATTAASGGGSVAADVVGAGVGQTATAIAARRAGGSVAAGAGSQIAGAAVGGAGVAIGSKVLGGAGGATLGGLIKGAGAKSLSAGKALWGGAKAAGSFLGGIGLGTIAAGGAIAGGLTEGIGYLRSGGGEGGQGYGSGQAGLYNESFGGAIARWMTARNQRAASEGRVEATTALGEQQAGINERHRAGLLGDFSANRAARASRAGFSTAAIAGGGGTEIEKLKKLELRAISEVAAARRREAATRLKQHEDQAKGLGFSNELQIAHIDEIREREADLLTIQQNRLGLLKAQNAEAERAVESSRSELKLSKEKLEAAQKSAQAARDSKLASFDKLTAQQKFDVKEIAEKKRSGEALTEQDVRKLEAAGLRTEADRFRANRSRGAASDLRTLGEFEASDGGVAAARDGERLSREKLKAAIEEEKKTKEKVAEQAKRTADALSQLAATVERITVAQAAADGNTLQPVADALNGATDSAVKDTQLVIESIKNMKESNAENLRQIREALDEADETKGAYK